MVCAVAWRCMCVTCCVGFELQDASCRCLCACVVYVVCVLYVFYVLSLSQWSFVPPLLCCRLMHVRHVTYLGRYSAPLRSVSRSAGRQKRR